MSTRYPFRFTHRSYSSTQPNSLTSRISIVRSSSRLPFIDSTFYITSDPGELTMVTWKLVINDTELDDPIEDTVDPYGQFVLEFNYHEYPSTYQLDMTGSS